MNTCRICDTTGEMQKIRAREMMFGTREEFTYFICPNCGCMQAETVPEDLGKYYGSDYYSYSEQSTEQASKVKDMTRVLDVGCGSGALLCDMAERGMGNLTGCDPFIEKDLFYDNGVKIYKKTIHQMDGEFDFIIMNDSFEHMSDPHEVMDSVRRLLASGGMARIRIPVFPNLAWDMFGANWYQLDAPRHLFLHSRKSMNYLAQKHGLRMVKTEYDSNSAQIVRSFLYQENIPYNEQDVPCIRRYFDDADLAQIEENAKIANQNQYGDHATFYLMQ